MKLPWTLVTAMVTGSFMLATFSQSNALVAATATSYNWKSHTEEQIQSRIADITLPFEVKYNGEIRNIIKDYVTSGYKDTEVMLGRSVLYFPIFDHFLSSYQLPKELKYLSIIESGLKPTAQSSVGAVGLWQFMPYTARQYGLVINSLVDERKDPYKSTEAAAKMLSELYDQFNDWALVLAAYNCGPGRVKKAIKAAGGQYDFWAIKNFLPLQTQKYIPTFIAAAYAANYYENHNLQPRYPNIDLGDVRVVKVYQQISFREIASRCNINQAHLRILNPSYVQQLIPNSARGNFLFLPANAARQFSRQMKDNMIGLKVAATFTAPLNTFESEYVVKAGEKITDLASRFSCSVQDIMRWNSLADSEVIVHQNLVIFLPKPNSKRA